MGHAFIEVILYKYSVFALDSNDHIWRIWMANETPLIERIIQSDPEWREAVRALRSRARENI